MAEHLFDDTFVVTRLNPDGKKFDKVSRVEFVTDDRRTYMQLDVAVEVYRMYEKQRFKMVLADTLNLDGTPDTGYFTQAGRETLADKFEYVMQGKLYRIADYVPPKPKEDADSSKKDADDTSNKDADDTSKNDDGTSSQKDAVTSKIDPKVQSVLSSRSSSKPQSTHGNAAPPHAPPPPRARRHHGHRDDDTTVRALPRRQLRHVGRQPPPTAPRDGTSPLGGCRRRALLRRQRYPPGSRCSLGARLHAERPQRAHPVRRRLPARRRRLGRRHAAPLPPQPGPPVPLRRQRGPIRPHHQVPLAPARPRHGQRPPRSAPPRPRPRQGQHHVQHARPRAPERLPAVRRRVPPRHRRLRHAPAALLPRAHRLLPLLRRLHLLHLVGEPLRRAAPLRAARAVAGVRVPRPRDGALVRQPPGPDARRGRRRRVPRRPLRRQVSPGGDRVADGRRPGPVRRQRAERGHVQPQPGAAPGVRRRHAAAAGDAHAGDGVRALQRETQVGARHGAALGPLLPQRQRGVRGGPHGAAAAGVVPAAAAGDERPAVPGAPVVRGEDGQGGRERDGGEGAGGGGVRGQGRAVRPRAGGRRVLPAQHGGGARELRVQRALEQLQRGLRRLLLRRPRRGDHRRSQSWIMQIPKHST